MVLLAVIVNCLVPDFVTVSPGSEGVAETKLTSVIVKDIELVTTATFVDESTSTETVVGLVVQLQPVIPPPPQPVMTAIATSAAKKMMIRFIVLSRCNYGNLRTMFVESTFAVCDSSHFWFSYSAGQSQAKAPAVTSE